MKPTQPWANLLLGASLLLSSTSFANLQPVNPPQAIPAFKVATLAGKTANDADLKNKVTIIRFWASW